MPSKAYQQRQRRKEHHHKNKEQDKVYSHERYLKFKSEIIQNKLENRQNDRSQRRSHCERQKKKLLTDSKYKEKNRSRALETTKKRLDQNADYRERNRKIALVNTARRLQEDEDYRERHRKMALVNTTRRLQEDEDYRERNRKMALVNTARRLQEDEDYRERNRKAATVNKSRRLQQDKGYGERYRKAALLNTTKRLQNSTYCKKNRENAARRHKLLSGKSSYREQRKTAAFERRRQSHTSKQRQTGSKRTVSDRQKYWHRRSKIIATANERRREFELQKSIMKQSNVSSLAVKMMFQKAKQCVNRGMAKLIRMHAYLKDKANAYCEQLPEDRNQPVTEEQFSEAVGATRIHTCSSEPYFWDSSYDILPAGQTIAVDSAGKAHIFKAVSSKSQPAQLESDEVQKVKRWLCNTHVCKISDDITQGLTELMSNILRTSNTKLMSFYCKIDTCGNTARTQQLGHAHHCILHENCNSLLRPVRLLQCHYPYLRTLTARLYEQLKTYRLIDAVNAAKTSNFSHMKEAVDDLSEFLVKKVVSSGNDSPEKVIRSCTVEEDAVVEQFSAALNSVLKMRDTYITTACDICEQLRDDVVNLTDFEGKKGFDSQKMTDMVDLLYQKKTQTEDVDAFYESVQICRYCADKLRAEKEVPRCVFNKLAVEETPACIQHLNIFEMGLIKQCITSVTIIRLGQVTNICRPQNELAAAMKGRIAYLPVDVADNASFIPDNLMNIDSFVILVGGQPTKSRKVWTSVVDLRKVHAALMWLRDNNPLYTDVPAYTVKELQAMIDKRLLTETDPAPEGKGILRKLNQAAKSHLYENFSIQPMTSEFPADSTIDYQLKKIDKAAENIFNTDLDAKAYPELFPTGANGMRDVSRTVKISTTDFLRSRLLNKNPKFRLNINYLFHSFQVQEISNMCHSIGHMLRTVSGNRLSAESLLKRLQSGDGELGGKLFSMMSNMRGTTEYFSKLAMEIRWMIRHLGPPTLFITVSIAEWFSEPLLEYIRKVNGGMGRDVDKMTPAELCAMDPVSVNLHFHKKWHAIFSQLIKSKTTPLFGEVADHFWRIEYQSRGAPHEHCLLWIKDAPILGRDSTEDVKQYIEKIITCEMPDKNKSPTLHELVTRFQSHNCNRYCQKSYRRNGKFYKKCRFGFPRPVRSETQLNDVVDCLAVDQSKQPRKRLYNVQRTEEEERLNDYNPALLLASQSNVDVQYIGHSGSRLPYYITSYITKHERSEQDKLWEEIYSASKTLGSNAMSFALKAVKSRQVGANEAADRLLGHKLFSKSRQLRFADLSPPDQTKRVLKPVADVEKLAKSNPDASDIFYPHWVLDVYPDRPDELESLSLHNFLSQYDKFSGKSKDHLSLKTLGYFLKKRTGKPYIITHRQINPNKSVEDEHSYYYQMLKLFVPWRAEEDIVLAGKTTKETFDELSTKHPNMADYNTQMFNQRKVDETIDETIKQKRQQLEDVEPDDDDPNTAFEGCPVSAVETAMQDVIDTHKSMTANNESDAEILYSSLNSDQKRVVDTVLQKLSTSEEPCRLIVSGEGGTGKSRVIHALQQVVAKLHKNIALPVAVTAPTGLAAFGIGGTTIHRLLSLPVEHGKPADYSRLPQEQLVQIRTTLQGLKLLIIDEISMVSSLTLLYIHLRLTEIMSNNQPFGGISIVCTGDFLQIQPVKGNQVFQPVTGREAKQRLGAISSVALWETFSYDELTINMRQQGDSVYADLLANARHGAINDTEYALLETRCISNNDRASMGEVLRVYHDLSKQDMSPVILMPRTQQCKEVNEAMLEELDADIVDLPAIDTRDTIVNEKLLPKVERAYSKVDEDITRTAGLDKCLRISIGAKVMLKRNICVEAGLVNGAVGTVIGFLKQNSHITAVNVLFRTTTQPVKIERQTSTFEVLKSIFYTRKQFPLMLAFAITIHKSQGLSLQSAIVDIGPNCFGSGMAYVALSRVTTLQGLHIIEISRNKITANRSALEEYNRLRSLYAPHLECFQLPNAKRSATDDSAPPLQHNKSKQRNKSVCRQKDDDCQPPVTENIAPPPPKKRKRRIKSPCRHQVDGWQPPEIDKEQNSTSESLVVAASIYRYYNISSIDEDFKRNLCEEINLHYHSFRASPGLSNRPIQRSMEELIYRQSSVPVSVQVSPTVGDGNCLFRALSLAISNHQENHRILRDYITNHMMHNEIGNHMANTFNQQNSEGVTFCNQIVAMQQPGTWGTEQEIVSAAHLFNCSILCCSQYGSSGTVCIQHFSPHFATNTTCTQECKHQSIYLVNNGTHYEPATVICKQNHIVPIHYMHEV